MDEQIFAQIIQLITERTGIIPRDSHRTGIKNYIEKQSNPDYYNYILNNREEMMNLINSATVNETYFFREEAQFHILQSKIFPQLVAANQAKPLRIWSAACSSGEEIYSLLLLADAMGIKTDPDCFFRKFCVKHCVSFLSEFCILLKIFCKIYSPCSCP